MKKFYTMTLALMVAGSAIAAPQIRQIEPVKKASRLSANLSASALKKATATKVKSNAEESTSIEGYYDFMLGDYYFQGGAGETSVPSNLSLDGTVVTISGDNDYFMTDLVGTYDAASNELTFNTIEIGAIQLQGGKTGYAAFQPFVYKEVDGEGTLEPAVVKGKYDPTAGTISFPADHGFGWFVYNDEKYTELAGYLDAWDVLGMKKGVDPETGWINMDKPAKWMDQMVWTAFMKAAPTEKEITVQVNEDQPGKYRMIAPFADIMGDANIILDATNPNDVTIDLQSTGIIDQTMGTCYIVSTSMALSDPSQGKLITMKGNRIEFPANSIWFYFPSYDQESVYGNKNQKEAGYLELPSDGSGVADIVIDENAPVEYFNLQGVRIANPVKGELVITRQGSKTTKMIVR